MKRLTIRGTALALGVFFDVTFVLCVLWGLAIPQFHANWLFEGLLPGFIWLSPQSIVLGLVDRRAPRSSIITGQSPALPIPVALHAET